MFAAVHPSSLLHHHQQQRPPLFVPAATAATPERQPDQALLLGVEPGEPLRAGRDASHGPVRAVRARPASRRVVADEEHHDSHPVLRLQVRGRRFRPRVYFAKGRPRVPARRVPEALGRVPRDSPGILLADLDWQVQNRDRAHMLFAHERLARPSGGDGLGAPHPSPLRNDNQLRLFRAEFFPEGRLGSPRPIKTRSSS